MTPRDFKLERRKRGWSQQELANRLGLSQSYVAMLEQSERKLTPRLVRKLAKVFALPPTVLPHSGLLEKRSGKEVAQRLAEQLASLGYPGFAYLRARQRHRNPDEVLLSALAQPELEARLVEALPWVVVVYSDMDASWLVREAKLRDLQNRVGFVVALARRVAERMEPVFPDKVQELRNLEEALEQSRLAKEDTLGKASLTAAEKNWLRNNRPPEAAHWNLLTDWRAENLRYDA